MTGDAPEIRERLAGIVAALRDLHMQATQERSHFYVGRVTSDAADVIESLTLERDRLREALTGLAATFERSNERWRRMAAESAAGNHRSSMAGEDDLPSHVLCLARAMMWEAAAVEVRAALAAGTETP